MNMKQFVEFLKEQKIPYTKVGTDILVGDVIYQFNCVGTLFKKERMIRE